MFKSILPTTVSRSCRHLISLFLKILGLSVVLQKKPSNNYIVRKTTFNPKSRKVTQKSAQVTVESTSTQVE